MRQRSRRRPGAARMPAAVALCGSMLLSGVAVAAPDEDEDLVVEDDEEDLDEDLDEDLEEEDPLDEETPEPTSSKAPESAERPSKASGSASVSFGGGAEAEGEGKRKRRKKDKKKKKRDSCAKKPFDVLDCVPDNHTLEVGMHGGLFLLGKNHGLFDAGVFSTQPELRVTNFDLGWRLLYLPIPYVGVGFEATLMPTRSPSEDAKALMYSLRGHVVGQAPWRITPTFLMGGGFLAIKSDRELLNSGDTFFYYGPGGKFYINDWLALRLEARHLVSGNGADGGRYHAMEIFAALDLTLALGRWVETSRRKKNDDRDGDGYNDKDDRCPDKYGEGNLGCPDDLDSDNDGYPDSRDRCPNEWGDSAAGCPVRDEDGDGILDSRDSCVDEAEVYNGYEDEDGCPDEEPESIKQLSGVIEGIYFDSGRATIKRESKPVLDQAARTLEEFPKVRLKITGHTDDTGKRDTNVSLSAKRAEAVKAYLVDKGIDASRLETDGVGPDKPIADNTSKAGRAKNRRIEFERLPDATE